MTGEMTGLERLRELIEDYNAENECVDIKCDPDLNCGQCMAKNVLEPIADQIEREQDEEAKSSLADYLRVRGVERDMERHLLGHEGMEDSPVARWARELREALGRHCRDGEGDTVAGSPYDALPDEGREAIAWVREHGGLHSVRMELDGLRAAIEETCTRLGARHTGELAMDVQAIWREIDRRLMPRGTKWPVDRDGVPIVPGETRFGASDGKEWTIDAVGRGFAWSGLSRTAQAKGKRPTRLRPEWLTKERPDSWERLEEDVASASCPDVYCANHHIDASDTSYEWAMARDIVRRARALAERDR